MRRVLIIGMIGLYLLMQGCLKPEKLPQQELYFNLDSLLDSQIELLAQEKKTLSKTVWLDGQEEFRRYQPDSAGWVREFKILRDISLGKAGYVGSYDVILEREGTLYQLKAGEDQPVHFVKVTQTMGNIYRIEGLFKEDKSIYKHTRNIQINLDGENIQSYEVQGSQSMILKDTIQYRISAEIL